MKKSIFYTRKFNKIIGNTIEEDGYIYKIIISSCDASFYLGSEEEKKKAHINHIALDYYDDEGLELVDYNCYIKKKTITAELIMRKRVDDILYC